MSSDGLPNSPRELVLAAIWGTLAFAAGFEAIAALVHGEWVPAVASFLLFLALMAIIYVLLFGAPMIQQWVRINPNWLPAACITLLLVVALSPYVEQRRWPFLGSFAPQSPVVIHDPPSTEDVVNATATIKAERDAITQERDAARQQLRGQTSSLQASLNDMTRQRDEALRRVPSSQSSNSISSNQASEPITWQKELTSWTSGDQSGLLFLGFGVRGKANVAAELTNAYVASEVTGEKKTLQISLAPGPQLAPISDINQIPPDAPIELWAAFTPPIHASDLLAQWGRFRFHAEYSGVSYDSIFDEAYMTKFLLQFPNSNIGPHVTKKSPHAD